MPISQTFLPEFDYELATARRVLERLDDAKWGFKPHEKSMTLGALASHLATIPYWTTVTVRDPGFEIPAGYQPEESPNREALLARFDASAKEARQALEGCTDAAWGETWTLSGGGKTLLAMPRAAVYRSFCMNHLIHHRGQLCVYLRLLDIPVPSVYGPSADEGQM